MHRLALPTLALLIALGLPTGADETHVFQHELILRPIVLAGSSIGFGDGGNCVIYPDSMRILSGTVTAQWSEPLPGAINIALHATAGDSYTTPASATGPSGTAMAFSDVPQATDGPLGWGYFIVLEPASEPALLYPTIHLTITMEYQGPAAIEPAATDASCGFS